MSGLMNPRLLLLALALASPGCTSLPAKSSAPPASEAQPSLDPESALLSMSAARLAAQGDLVPARAQLERLPEAQRQAPATRFLQACIALEAGEFATVDALLAGWKEPAPEVRLLQHLATLRREQPGLDWRSAFLQAWRAVGRPDFQHSSLLPPSWDVFFGTEDSGRAQAWSRARTDESRFLLALMQPEADHVRAALQHPPDRLPPEFLITAADTFLKPSLPEDVRAQATRWLRDRFTQLAAAHPDSLQYPALALLLGTSLTAPFTPEELQRIDVLSRRSTWRQMDSLTLYRAALGPLKETGLSRQMAQSYAYTIVVGTLAGPASWVLQKRAEASQDSLSAEERQRLGEALGRIGERLAAENSLVEHLIGLAVMKRGAITLGDLPRQAELILRQQEEGRLMGATSRLVLSRWPLASLADALFEANLRDEAASFRDFEAPDESEP